MRGNAVVTEHTDESGLTQPEPRKAAGAGSGEPAWYAIHTYSGYENKVKSHLEARIASMDMRNKIFRVMCQWKKRWRSNRASGAPCSARSSPVMCWWK